MNDRTEARLRNDLAGVDLARVPDVATVGAAVTRVTRQRAARRRVVAGALAVGLVFAGGAAVWNSSAGREQVTSGDGDAPTTLTAASTAAPTTAEPTASTAVDATATCCGWSAIPRDPRGLLYRSAVIWTGTEAISVGGVDANGAPVDGAAAYDPTSDSWRVVSTEPLPLLAPIVAWTGAEVLAIGWAAEGAPRSVAALLDPTTGKWRIASDSPARAKLWSANPWVWTGSNLLVTFGDVTDSESTALAYDPLADSWRQLRPAPISPRDLATSVWTGTQWIVWGGTDGAREFNDGATYDFVSGTWRTMAASPLSARRFRGGGVWTGQEVLIDAGASGGDAFSGNGEMALADGAAYDPVSDSWRSIADGPAHPGFVPIWTGTHMLLFAKGGVVSYDAAADRWDEGFDWGNVAHDDSAPVWTGSAVVLLGSYDGANGGAVFTPPA